MKHQSQFTITALFCCVCVFVLNSKCFSGEELQNMKVLRTFRHLSAPNLTPDIEYSMSEIQNGDQAENNRGEQTVSQPIRKIINDEIPVSALEMKHVFHKMSNNVKSISSKKLLKTRNASLRFDHVGKLPFRNFVNGTDRKQLSACAEKRLKRDVINDNAVFDLDWKEYIQNTMGLSVNIDVLLEAYSKICPITNFCHMKMTNSKFLYKGLFPFAECEYCICDSKCIGTGNCCPTSIYGYLPTECRNTILISDNKFRTQYNLMITRCPLVHGKPSNRQNMCSGPDSELKPVTSRRTLFTYKNRFCAQCHGDYIFTDWAIYSECKGNVTFAYSRSLAEARSKLYANKCMLVYKNENAIKCNPLFEKQVTVKRCNITGLWKTYNSDIEWACKNLNLRFSNFKNVFCYICNPSSATRQYDRVISSCNITGLWKYLDPYVESACRKFGESTRILPFKNIYCILCNGISSMTKYSSHHNYFFQYRFSSKSLHTVIDLETRLFNYKASLSNNYANLLSTFKRLLPKALRNETAMKTPLKKVSFFMKKDDSIDAFLKEFVGICGQSSICNKSLLNKINITEKYMFKNPICGDCSCLAKCIFTDNCCVDLLLQIRPYSCYEVLTHHPSNEIDETPKPIVNKDTTGIVMIDKCMDSTNWLAQKCETENKTDILSLVPVRRSKIIHTFKNIYCFLCSHMYSHYISPFTAISYHCAGYIEPWLNPDIDSEHDWIDSNCMMKMQPTWAKPCPAKYTVEVLGNRYTRLSPEIIRRDAVDYFDATIYDKCNKTGFWKNEKSFVKQICTDNSITTLKLPDYRIENTLYKNVACFICNPARNLTTFPTEKLVASCNKSVSTNNTETERTCIQGELHRRWLPYKNFACEDCNLPPLKTIYVDPDGVRFSHVGRPVSYKSMFYMNHETWRQISKQTVSSKQTTTTCPLDSLRLLNVTCDDLRCREGLELVKWTCTPVVDILLNSPFRMTATVVEEKMNSSCRDSKELQENVCLSIAEKLAAEVGNTTSVVPKDCVWFQTGTCNETLKSGNGNISVVEFTFLISVFNGSVAQFQNNLMEFFLKDLYFDNDTEHCFLQISFENFTDEYEVKEHCKYETVSHAKIPASVAVDRFFTCPYFDVKLDSESLSSPEGSNDINLNGVYVPRKFYGKIKNKIRLCLQDYLYLSRETHIEKKTSHLIKAFTTFSTVCTVLSIICLLLTCLTYSIFPSLRTVPGKINVALTVTLLLAQSIYMSQQFIVSLSSYSSLCTALGMLCHYFWLASFCAMNACSYHMYRLFSGNLQMYPSLNYNSSFSYLLYIASIPLVFVASTVGINMFISSNSYCGYGTVTCFLSDFYSLILSFIIPAGLIFVSNIVFFSSVFYTIKSSQNRMRSARDRADFLVYVRLCAVIGVAWPLLIAEGAFEISWFSFIASGTNALQGVFIFVSYVCNNRVWNMYRSIITTRSTTSTDSVSQSRR